MKKWILRGFIFFSLTEVLFLSKFFFLWKVLGISLIVLLIYYLVVFKKSNRKWLNIFTFIFLLLVLFHLGVLMDLWTTPHCSGNKQLPQWESVISYDDREITNSIQSKAQNWNLTTLVKIAHQKDSLPIDLLRTNRSGANGRVLILAGMHGTEPSGTYSIPIIMDSINRGEFQNWDFDIIYALNPEGLTTFSRMNEEGCDINRDFNQYSTIQASLIKNLVDSVEYQAVIDFHEGLYSGHFLIFNNVASRTLKSRMATGLKENEIAKSSYMSTFSIEGFLKYYKFDSFVSPYGKVRTLHNLLSEKRILGVVSESDADEQDFKVRVRNQVIVFDLLMTHLEDAQRSEF